MVFEARWRRRASPPTQAHSRRSERFSVSRHRRALLDRCET